MKDEGNSGFILYSFSFGFVTFRGFSKFQVSINKREYSDIDKRQWFGIVNPENESMDDICHDAHEDQDVEEFRSFVISIRNEPKIKSWLAVLFDGEFNDEEVVKKIKDSEIDICYEDMDYIIYPPQYDHQLDD